MALMRRAGRPGPFPNPSAERRPDQQRRQRAVAGRQPERAPAGADRRRRRGGAGRRVLRRPPERPPAGTGRAFVSSGGSPRREVYSRHSPWRTNSAARTAFHYRGPHADGAAGRGAHRQRAPGTPVAQQHRAPRWPRWLTRRGARPLCIAPGAGVDLGRDPRVCAHAGRPVVVGRPGTTARGTTGPLEALRSRPAKRQRRMLTETAPARRGWAHWRRRGGRRADGHAGGGH